MSHSKSLSITGQKGKILSSEQMAFNKLTQKLNLLAEKHEKDKEKFEYLNRYFLKYIEPVERTLAREKINAAVILHHLSDKFRFSSKQKDKIAVAIVYLMTSGFPFHEPSAEEKSIFDFWSPQTYDQMEEEELEMQKSQLRYMMEIMGVENINLDDFDPDNPEVIAKIAEQIKEAGQKRKESHEGQNKKKTKRQLQKEQEEKATLAVQKKSLREVYIGLAKVLHPDTGDTTVDTAQKEELMKQVTLAYESGDLATLLSIETGWINRQENDINTLSNEKLSVYINLLKKRLTEMESAYHAMRNSPKYRSVAHLFNHSLPNAENKLRKQKRTFDERLKGLRLENDYLKQRAEKDYILNLVNDINSVIETEMEERDFMRYMM